MRVVLGSLPQLVVMAAVVATAMLVPLVSLLWLLALLIFGVSLHDFLTFGDAVELFPGVMAWWALVLAPALAYSAWMMPWEARDS